jgi:hypothetical protein
MKLLSKILNDDKCQPSLTFDQLKSIVLAMTKKVGDVEIIEQIILLVSCMPRLDRSNKAIIKDWKHFQSKGMAEICQSSLLFEGINDDLLIDVFLRTIRARFNTPWMTLLKTYMDYAKLPKAAFVPPQLKERQNNLILVMTRISHLFIISSARIPRLGHRSYCCLLSSELIRLLDDMLYLKM